MDGLNLGYSAEDIARECREADLVGISCLSGFYLETLELAKCIKKRGQKLIIGGPHASSLPHQTLIETGADFVVIGEGENTLLELLQRLEKGQDSFHDIPGLIVSSDQKIIKRPLIKELDSLPYPDWEAMDPRECKKAPHGALIKRFPVAPIISTRGCPYECTFCASPYLWDRKIRFRSPENVVSEIEYLVKNFDVREIHFEDDNLTLNRKHAQRICELILDRNLDITWATPNGVRVDTITPDLLQLMKKSGCYYIAFGVESGNEQILENIKKKTNLKVVEQAIRDTSEAGIMTQGFFIFGLPGETKETIEETIEFAKRVPLDRAQFLNLDVIPGSQLWFDLDGQKIADWSKRSYQEVTWVPPTVDKETLQEAPSKAFRSFFFRPKQMLKLLSFLRPSQLHFVIRRLLDFRILPGRSSSHENTVNKPAL